MIAGVFQPTSEEITAAFLIAIAVFFLYLQLRRFARLAASDRHREDEARPGQDEGDE